MHKTTIEFTKAMTLSSQGDCILGVGADFDTEELVKFAQSNDKEEAMITITADEVTDKIRFRINRSFSSDDELVIRRGEFASVRTLGIFADKSAMDIDRRIVEHLKVEGNFAMVKII